MPLKLEKTLSVAALLLLGAVVILCAPSARAQEKHVLKPHENKILTGVPFVHENGALSMNGKTIALWGIDMLAPDQQCWQGNVAWFCGDQATVALRHFVEGRMLSCELQQVPDEGAQLAKCYRQKGAQRKDVSETLVRHGWAMDRGETSGGAYFAAEEEARKEKRGIWSSRFQSAQDWKEGVQRYINDPDHEQPATEEKDSDESDSDSGE